MLDQKKSQSKEGGKRSEAPGAERIYSSATDLFPPSFDSASDVCCQKVSNPPDKMVKDFFKKTAQVDSIRLPCLSSVRRSYRSPGNKKWKQLL